MKSLVRKAKINASCIFGIFLCFLSVVTFAQDSVDRKALERMLYGDLTRIESFVVIYVLVQGTDLWKADSENEIGLSSAQMSDYLRLRYRNNFADIPYVELTEGLFGSEEINRTRGRLWCAVWTVGDSYPVAFHVECQIGTLHEPNVLRRAVLGYARKELAIEEIRKEIDSMLTEFAQVFFRVRGEI
ncbi:MAG: hypothetical protein WDZ63_01840 [Burkholderiales bacterium]